MWVVRYHWHVGWTLVVDLGKGGKISPNTILSSVNPVLLCLSQSRSLTVSLFFSNFQATSLYLSVAWITNEFVRKIFYAARDHVEFTWQLSLARACSQDLALAVKVQTNHAFTLSLSTTAPVQTGAVCCFPSQNRSRVSEWVMEGCRDQEQVVINFIHQFLSAFSSIRPACTFASKDTFAPVVELWQPYGTASEGDVLFKSFYNLTDVGIHVRSLSNIVMNVNCMYTVRCVVNLRT